MRRSHLVGLLVLAGVSASLPESAMCASAPVPSADAHALNDWPQKDAYSSSPEPTHWIEPHMARKWILIADSPRLPNYLKEGKEAEDSGDAQSAIRLYRKAYHEGSAEAAERIADIYQIGKGNVQRDFQQAIVWRARAEKIDDTKLTEREILDRKQAAVDRAQKEAQFASAWKLTNQGLDWEERGYYKTAIIAYLKAVREGSGMAAGVAARQMAGIYATGKGDVKKDLNEARKWYARAEALGVDVERPRRETIR